VEPIPAKSVNHTKNKKMNTNYLFRKAALSPSDVRPGGKECPEWADMSIREYWSNKHVGLAASMMALSESIRLRQNARLASKVLLGTSIVLAALCVLVSSLNLAASGTYWSGLTAGTLIVGLVVSLVFCASKAIEVVRVSEIYHLFRKDFRKLQHACINLGSETGLRLALPEAVDYDFVEWASNTKVHQVIRYLDDAMVLLAGQSRIIEKISKGSDREGKANGFLGSVYNSCRDAFSNLGIWDVEWEHYFATAAEFAQPASSAKALPSS
jgi:hypothetical protein